VSLKRAVIANYVGQGWVALMGLVFVPLYVRYLGMEAYGLIGVFSIMQAWFSLLDFGMTPILTREMARVGAGAVPSQSSRDLLRGTEFLMAGASLALMGVVWTFADWLATHWLRPGALALGTVAQALTLMAVVACLRSVEAVYRGSAIGQEKQVTVNLLAAVFATLRGAGAAAVLFWVSTSIAVFFIWQIVVSGISVLVLRAVVYRGMGAPRSEAFSFLALRPFQGFAGGMIGITIAALLLTQIDKMLLSRLLELSAYGSYTLAAIAANAMFIIVVPITQAFYPRFAAKISIGDGSGVNTLFHGSAQLVTVLVGPVAMLLVLFPDAILMLWIGDESLAGQAAPLMSALALGTLFNCLMWVPYQLQLAHGHTRTALEINVVAVAAAIPAILFVTPRYGAIGAAWVWVALNAGYLFVGVNLMFSRLPGFERRRWYLQDICAPLGAAAGVVVLARAAMHADANRISVPELLLVLSLAMTAGVSAAPTLRRRALSSLRARFSGRSG
jgi:O-antigen/teichoic acid export membrane protein